MKKLLIMMLFFTMAFTAKAQYYSYEFDVDSIVASSSLDTVIFTQPSTVDFSYAGTIGLYVKCDSISGATGGTIAYQVMPYGGTVWHTIDTDTFNGAGATFYNHEAVCYARKHRIYITVPSSTQTTYFYTALSYKRTHR